MSDQYPVSKDDMKSKLEKNAKGGAIGDVGSMLMCVAAENPYKSATYGDLIGGSGWVPVALHYLGSDEVLVQWAPYTDVIDE